MSYAVDEKIDEFARVFAGILRRLIKDQQIQQTQSKVNEE
jgi:hypothetical protein